TSPLETPTQPPPSPVVPRENPSPDKSDLYPVTRVIDGDTLEVSINGQTEKVRLIGIDTPESVHPSKPVECFGMEASNKAKETLEGQQVRLESDQSQGDRDKYQRLLRYVFLENGTNFNKMMIEQGYAHEYTYNSPYKYQTEFIKAEKQARTNKAGFWADGACESPETETTPAPQPEQTKNTGDCRCESNIYGSSH
ncbi:thermonuclease family protein, partial [Candidatus Omnitrophota bacterium]